MRAPRPSSLVRCLSVIVAWTAACEPGTEPAAPGAIMVAVQTQGTDLPIGGYRVSVDGGPLRAVDSLNLRATFTGVTAAAHTVQLEVSAVNCSVAGQNPITVTVVSNETALAQFTVACVANHGTVRVTTATTGNQPDPDGYLVMVDGVQRVAAGLNGTVSVADVRAGLHAVSLGDVARNCRITSASPVNVIVTFHGTVDVHFTIACAVSGSITVTVVTTGVDFDLDGYTVDVQAPSVGFSERREINPSEITTFTQLLPATDYRVALQELSANCLAGVTQQTVAVTEGSTTNVGFDVSCEAVQRLAIVRNNDIYVINSNGSDAVPLVTDPAFDGDPAWSSTGRIAFVTGRHGSQIELYVMNADGTNQVRITTVAGDDDSPSWSADGSKIVFQSSRDANPEIYVVNSDGTGLTRLTDTTTPDYQPSWSSTGKIAFVSQRDHPAGEIYVMNEDGSNVVRLTNNASAESSPSWSPDGSMIAFARAISCYYYCDQDLFVMNADGSNERRLATGTGPSVENAHPAWSPNGQVIAYTRTYCPYYCDLPELWVVPLHGTAPVLLAPNASNPAWKP